MALTGYFIASGIGILAGGFLADRVKRQERLMAVSFLISAACVITVGIAGFSLQNAIAMLFVTGLFYGLVAPSRDILVRNAAPPGSVGTVFAIVSTGFTVSVIGPPLFGWIIDLGLPAFVFYGSAIFTLLAITTLFGAKSGAPR
jgi:MFS family permease